MANMSEGIISLTYISNEKNYLSNSFTQIIREHGELGGGLKGRGEARRGAEKNVKLNKSIK